MRTKLCLILFILFTNSIYSQKNSLQSASYLLKTGKLDEALTQINYCINDFSNQSDPKTWFIRGNILFEISNSKNNNYSSLDVNSLEHAIESYKKALELDIKKDFWEDIYAKLTWIRNNYFNQAVEFYDQKQYKGAMTDFENGANTYSILNLQDTLSLYYAAVCASMVPDKGKAKEYYLLLIKANSKTPAVYTSLSDIYRQEKDFDNAINIIQIAKKLFPNNLQLLLAETNIYLTSGQNEKALAYLKSAILGDPNNSTLFFALGTIYDKYANDSQRPDYERTNYFELAKDQYLTSISKKPDYFEPNYNLGVLYVNKAAEIMEKANALPIDASASFNTMSIQANTLLSNALPFLETALEIQPADQSILNSLKQIYTRLNKLLIQNIKTGKQYYIEKDDWIKFHYMEDGKSKTSSLFWYSGVYDNPFRIIYKYDLRVPVSTHVPGGYATTYVEVQGKSYPKSTYVPAHSEVNYHFEKRTDEIEVSKILEVDIKMFKYDSISKKTKSEKIKIKNMNEWKFSIKVNPY